MTSRPNELLLRLWTLFRVADRRGERRSRAYAAGLAHLAGADFHGAHTAPFSNRKAEVLGYGYDPLADAVWLHRDAIGPLTDHSVAAPAKNFFAREKPIIRKLVDYALESRDTDLDGTFAETFSSEQIDVDALQALFDRTPDEVSWIGFPEIGWDIPKDVFWIGVVNPVRTWRAEPAYDTDEHTMAYLRAVPQIETWAKNERDRAIHISALIRPFPIRARPPWADRVVSGELQEWKIWYAPDQFWGGFLHGLATAHGATLVEDITPGGILAEACSFGPYHGTFAFWHPATRGMHEWSAQYRESFLDLRQTLVAKKRRVDWYVMASESLYKFIYDDVYRIARSGLLDVPLLIFDKPRVTCYADLFPWLHDLRKPTGDFPDEERLPRLHASSGDVLDAAILIYNVVWIMHGAMRRPPTSAVVRSFVTTMIPHTCFEDALGELISANMLSRKDDALRHVDRRLKYDSIGTLARRVGCESLAKQVLAWMSEGKALEDPASLRTL